MNGWAGRILRVNLSKGDSSVENLDKDLAFKFIGGRGLASKFLFDEVDPKVDPLSPENKLIFATGPLAGTGGASAGRFMVVTKSPLTGAIACPNCGGYFSSELKFAGYDMLIFEGKAPEPVYLSIIDDDVEIKPAKHLWGKGTSETENIIRSEMGDARKPRKSQIASIGPAGENLARMACVVHDNRAAARSAVGAVMGSKNLKAVAVKGTKRVTVADPKGLKNNLASFIQELKDDPFYGETMRNFGTWFLPEWAIQLGMLPTRNFQARMFDGWGNYSKEDIKDKLRVRSKSCLGCPLSCKQITRIPDSEFQGTGGGPEYESMASLGPNCGIGDIYAITKANYLCNELGIDTIEVGGTIACAMELYERGFLPEKDAGYQLNFGNTQALIELIRLMGQRQGFGDILAEGGYSLAQKYGHPELFMGVKKQAMPVWHPQGSQSVGLSYATSNMGACHTKGQMDFSETRLDPAGKALENKKQEDFIAAKDACGFCWNVFGGDSPWDKRVSLLLELATGAGCTEDDLRLTGERIWNLERLFNLRAGFTAKDDTLPKRMLEEPVLKGEAEGAVVRLDVMLPEYYQLRGWDKKGVPTLEKLAQLGLTREAGRL